MELYEVAKKVVNEVSAAIASLRRQFSIDIDTHDSNTSKRTQKIISTVEENADTLSNAVDRNTNEIMTALLEQNTYLHNENAELKASLAVLDATVKFITTQNAVILTALTGTPIKATDIPTAPDTTAKPTEDLTH